MVFLHDAGHRQVVVDCLHLGPLQTPIGALCGQPTVHDVCALCWLKLCCQQSSVSRAALLSSPTLCKSGPLCSSSHTVCNCSYNCPHVTLYDVGASKARTRTVLSWCSSTCSLAGGCTALVQSGCACHRLQYSVRYVHHRHAHVLTCLHVPQPLVHTSHMAECLVCTLGFTPE